MCFGSRWSACVVALNGELFGLLSAFLAGVALNDGAIFLCVAFHFDSVFVLHCLGIGFNFCAVFLCIAFDLNFFGLRCVGKDH